MMISLDEARDGRHKGSRALSLRVAESQNWRCAYCARVMTDDGYRWRRPTSLTMDHIIPRSRGGRYSYANCVAACYRCNHARGTIDALLFYEHVQLHKELTRDLRKRLEWHSRKQFSRMWGDHHSKNKPLRRLYYHDGKGGITEWEKLNPDIHDRP